LIQPAAAPVTPGAPDQVATKRWRVVVAKLGAGGVVHEAEVDASNWMGALRKTREGMSERPSVPPGVSCSIDGDGVATVLDAASRRKFVLSPLAGSATAASPPAAEAPAAPAPATAAPSAEPAEAKRKRFQTVAFTEGMTAMGGGPAVAVGVGAKAVPAAPEPPSASSPMPPVTVAETRPAAPASPPRPRLSNEAELELVYSRDVEPTAENPLCYRERAYVVQRGVLLAEAEGKLRTALDVLKHELAPRPRGKLVNLALFDHRFRDAPERPPVVTVQWRDWRDDVVVEYPASTRQSSLPPPPGPSSHDDRLAEVFEALEALSHKPTAADGLDFGVQLIERVVPAEAISACLYDINTDELRFVAVLGSGAEHVQGKAVPRNAGLFAQALRVENQATLVRDVLVEPAFNPDVDSRPGLDAQSILLRPMSHERQLVGMLQLVNRRHTAGFDAADINIVSYVAERLAEFVLVSRRAGSKPPPRR